jgi:hypothetical protein
MSMEIVHVVHGEHPLDHFAGLRTSNQICIDQPIVAVEGPVDSIRARKEEGISSTKALGAVAPSRMKMAWLAK